MNTPRRQEALEFIASRQKRVTVGPTGRELAAHLGVYPHAAQRHVEALRATGELEPENGRGLVVAKNPKPPADRRSAELLKRPIFLKPSATRL